MSWVERVLAGELGAEQEVVERYSVAMLQIAERELPIRIKSRVDPEDIVQSVYRSFFRRLKRSEFSFDESQDIWRLLVVMTYNRLKNTIAHHQRAKRDARGEFHLAEEQALPSPTPRPEDLTILVETLEELLEGFPDTHRRVVELRMSGMTNAEIAAEVELSERTVIRIINRVRERATMIARADESLPRNLLPDEQD